MHVTPTNVFVSTSETSRPSGETFWLSHDTVPLRTTGGSRVEEVLRIERNVHAVEDTGCIGEGVRKRRVDRL